MKWSQEELAEQLGLNRGNIASYESGTAEPKICNLIKFARLFKITIFDLTHNNLKDENSYLHAIQRQQNAPALPSVKQYATGAKEYEGAIKGLECIFRMKLRSADQASEDMAFYKNQFEQLYNVATHLLRSHFELIATVQSKCNEHKDEQ